MEYQLDTKYAHASDDEIKQAVICFLNPIISRSLLRTSPQLYSNILPAGNLSNAGKSTTPKKLTMDRIKDRQPPGFQCMVPRAQAQNQGIQFRPVSDLGGLNKHYFITDGQRLLSTDARAGQMHWHLLTMNWHQPVRLGLPLSVQADAPASPVAVWQMTDNQKLTVAFERALLRTPATMARDFFTATNIAIMVGMTVLLLSTGILEVLGLGVLIFGAVMGGLDLVLNVTQLAVDGYRKAIAAQNDEDLDAAAELFSEALTKGLFDILSIVTGYKAAGLLKGKGILSVGQYFAYLKRELEIWRASRAAAAALVKPPVVPPPPDPPLPPKAPKPPTPPKGEPVPTEKLTVEQRSLQHMFGKHAKDFGVTGNWNKAMAVKFEEVLRGHVERLTPIEGTYRGTQQALHYFDPDTGLIVMTDRSGNLIGGWKLGPEQIKNLLLTGNVQ